jgi:hypothetical protein
VKSALLDAFTERDLEVWETRSIDLQSYHDRVYYDLERQRAARYEELCVALRAAPAREVLVDRWVRVTGPLTSRPSKLMLSELALRSETSFVTFSLHGRLEQVFDLRVRSGLTAFAKAIAAFDVSGDTKKFAQRMRLSPRDLIRTPHELWKRLLNTAS